MVSGVKYLNDGPYSEWLFRARVEITNPVSTANYQYKLNLTWQPGMREDFSDIRFTQEDGLICPFWIRSDNIVSATSCEVWIKIPDANKSHILIYWGNPACSSESDGDKVFTFFDDFIGSTLDTAKWNSYAYYGTIVVSGGLLAINSTGSGGTGSYVRSKAAVGLSAGVVMARLKTAHFGTTTHVEIFSMRMSVTDHSQDAAAFYCYTDATSGQNYLASYTTADRQAITGWAADTFAVQTNKSTGNLSSNYDYFDVNGGTPVAVTGTSHNTNNGFLQFQINNVSGASITADWIACRLYAATEPTLTLDTSMMCSPSLYPVTVMASALSESCSFSVSYGFATPSLGLGIPPAELEVRYGFIAAGKVDRPLPTTLMISGSASRDLAVKCWTAHLRYWKGTTGGAGSSIFGSTHTVLAPDHNAVNRCVFHGFIDSENADYMPANNSEEFIAYDFQRKLSGQIVPDYLLEILSPTDQGSAAYQRLDIKAIAHMFHRGKIITGETSGAIARIAATPGIWLYSADRTESYLVPSSRLVLSNITGTFTDSEKITETGGTGEAYVNGAVSPLDFGVSTYYPEGWLRELLGGDNWQNTTGICPYRLNPVGSATGTWTAKPYDTWFLPDEQKKQQSIDDVFNYHNFIVLVKWKDIGLGGYTPCMYAVHQDDIDQTSGTDHMGLDLPAKVMITNGTDTYLVGTVRLKVVGEGRINKVTIRCQDLDGVWYQNTRESGVTESAGVFGDGEIVQDYYKVDQNLISQADCDTAAALIYPYLSVRQTIYYATFQQRTDFEFLQLLEFSGYTEIPDGEYRIIHIEPRWAPAAVFVDVTLIPNSQFKASLAVNKMYTNPTLEIQRVIRAELAKQAAVVAGVVTVVDGNKVTGTTEAGISLISRKIS